MVTVLSINLNGQYREVPVGPGVGTLNDVIAADAPNRTPDTWYVLERGTESAPKIYLVSSTLEPDFPLNIKSAGTGDRRPMLIPLVGTGGTSARILRPKNNVHLIGLYLTHENSLGAFGDNNIIRSARDSIRITVEDCWFDKDGQSAIRLDNKLCKVYVKNSIFSNIGQEINLDNGRFLDARGVLQDTIYVENTYVYNITSRIYRNGGGPSVYQYWNHNTLINSGQHCLDIDEVGTAVFTNNLIINGAFFGQEGFEDSARTWDDRFLLEFSSVGTQLNALGITQQSLTVNNNNAYLSPAIKSLYPLTNDIEGRREILFLDSLSQLAVDQAGVGSTIISEDVGIIDGPLSPVALTTAYLDTAIEMGDYPDFENRAPASSYEFNFMYNQSSQSFTGGSDGKPLGSLKQWIDAGIVGIKELVESTFPTAYKLFSNYPNPFNPSTKIRFSVPYESNIKLVVYNSLGQQISVLVDKRMGQGTYSADFDASSLASGIYLYQLQTDNFTATKKMILMK